MEMIADIDESKEGEGGRENQGPIDGFSMATLRRAPRKSTATFERKILHDAGLDDPRVQSQEHELGIQCRAGLERRLDSPFDLGRKICVICACERIAADHAIS